MMLPGLQVLQAGIFTADFAVKMFNGILGKDIIFFSFPKTFCGLSGRNCFATKRICNPLVL
jgi:hypothetical protein